MALIEQLAWSSAASALGRLWERILPGPLGRAMPEQAALAGAQGLRPGLAGLSGSEAAWYSDAQGVSTIGSVPLAQDLTSARRPVSTFVPHVGDQPLLARDFDQRPWGQAWPVPTSRPALLRGPELVEPGDPDPRPRTVQAEVDRRQGDDPWAGFEEG